MSMRALFSCVHSVGLGQELGNNLDRREGESARTLKHRYTSCRASEKKRQLILNNTKKKGWSPQSDRVWSPDSTKEQKKKKIGLGLIPKLD